MVGKKLGSLEDRDYIKRKLVEPSFQISFYNLIKGLGEAYFISINNISKACSSFNQETLVDFVKNDELENYFIIGKDFAPNDDNLLGDKMVGTIITEFQKLYPLYLLLKFK